MKGFRAAYNEGDRVKFMYREHLLDGDILKMDGGGNDFIEVIDRDKCDYWNLRKNVGCNRGEKISRYPKLFLDVIKELESDGYLVEVKESDMSGCCQYHAYWYAVVGEKR